MNEEELTAYIISKKDDPLYHFSPHEYLKVILYQNEKIKQLNKGWGESLIELVREVMK